MPSDNTKHSPTAPPAEKIWWVYMVRAENGHLYTGISTDPERRFQEHVSGSRRSARFFNRSPAQALVWRQVCADHSEALRREIALKKLAKKVKEALIAGVCELPELV
ncbi:MAG: GIY-YIG nuclease family protein [Gammaproteobacteria bacterium]|nr:GIY-YIG nuclease family protein [Gammaproteobacteria bacterium]